MRVAEGSAVTGEAPEACAQTVQWREALLHGGGRCGPLALRHCTPVGQRPMAQVVVAAAVGVPQTYYAAFAQGLAQQGYAVTTFDYRGHAQSLHGPLRAVKADLLNWAADCLAVAQRLRAGEHGHLPLLWIGHSVGAQLPGVSPQPLPIDGLLGIATGSGYWRDNAPATKRKVWLWWWGIQPVVTWLCGCFPGKRWGLVGDLPAGVVWQWRCWCLDPDYAMGAEGAHVRARYDAARYPVHVLRMQDDEMMSARSAEELLGWYRHAAAQQLEVIAPADSGLRCIGHFGFFRKEMQPTLWPLASDVLARWVQAAQGPCKSGARD